jgi:hypothetical protein
MDFITGVGLGNAAIAATAAYGAKDKTFEEKFNERIRVYEDEKKSLEKMIDILKKEKAACESKKESEVRPAEPVPVTETAPVETNTAPLPLPEPPGPEPPIPQPTIETPELPLIPEAPEPALFPEALPPGPPAATPESAIDPSETNTILPEVPVPEPEPPLPQPSDEPMNEALMPELPIFAEPPEYPPAPPVAEAVTRRSLYQRSLQDARQAVEADTAQFPNFPRMDATVSRALPALPPRPPRSFSRPEFNPSEERTTFTPTRGRTRGGTRLTRKKKLRTRRATKQKNVRGTGSR